MVRYKLLLILVTCAVSTGISGLLLPVVSIASTIGCTAFGASFDSCSGAQTSGNRVDVWANQTSAGASGSGSTWGGVEAGPAAGTAAGGLGAPWSFYPRVADSPQQARGYCYVLVNRAASCFAVATPAEAPIAEAAFVMPNVTKADIASFRPENPTMITEPRGWAVMGLESNMIAGTRTHNVSGQLLGVPAEVRFTPANFEWNYGDGGSRESFSAGETWATQGLAEFSPTLTSHVYRQTGSFQPSVRVWFSLEYRWGSGTWTGMSGRVSADASAPVLLVVRAANVLVQEPCLSGKYALGC